MIIVKELEKRLGTLGEIIGYGKWGDSKHYFKRADNISKDKFLTDKHRS